MQLRRSRVTQWRVTDPVALAEADAGIRQMYVRLALANALGAATMILGVLVSFGLDWGAPGLLVLAIGGAAAIIYATYGWIHGNRWRKRRNLLFVPVGEGD